MKKLWYVLPAFPILALLFITSLFIDPWWAVWVATGGGLAIVGALLGFLATVFKLLEIAERKNNVR